MHWKSWRVGFVFCPRTREPISRQKERHLWRRHVIIKGPGFMAGERQRNDALVERTLKKRKASLPLRLEEKEKVRKKQSGWDMQRCWGTSQVKRLESDGSLVQPHWRECNQSDNEQRDCWAATGSCTRTGKISTIIGLRIGAEGYNVCVTEEVQTPSRVKANTFPSNHKGEQYLPFWDHYREKLSPAHSYSSPIAKLRGYLYSEQMPTHINWSVKIITILLH